MEPRQWQYWVGISSTRGWHRVCCVESDIEWRLKLKKCRSGSGERVV